MSDGGIRCRSLTEDGLVDFQDYHGTWACWPKDGYDVASGLERQGFTRLAEQLYWRLLNGVNVAGAPVELLYGRGAGEWQAMAAKHLPGPRDGNIREAKLEMRRYPQLAFPEQLVHQPVGRMALGPETRSAHSLVKRCDLRMAGVTGDTRGSTRRLQRIKRWMYRIKRWMYRSGRPGALARVMNRISAVQFSAGLLSPNRAMTMEVVGRRTGRLLSFPVVVTDYEGERYLVSILGNGANWVRNVRAADGMAVLRRGHREAVRLEEVDLGARAPILRRYLAVAPGARPHLPVDRRAPLEEFERIGAEFPVFHVRAF